MITVYPSTGRVLRVVLPYIRRNHHAYYMSIKLRPFNLQNARCDLGYAAIRQLGVAVPGGLRGQRTAFDRQGSTLCLCFLLLPLLVCVLV